MIRAGLVAGLLVFSQCAAAWHFAIVGDTPYSTFERRHLPEMLDEIARTQPAFIVHVGDIKGGSERCDDSLFDDRLALFNAVSAPLIYTPGDNDWTDCRRPSNGGYRPSERLAKLRSVFFGTPQSLGKQTLELTRQPGVPENQRWQRDGIVFATLHMVGSYNNASDRAEMSGRDAATRQWMDAAFDAADQSGARALVLIAHGDPHFKAYAAGHAPWPFIPFLDQLRAHLMRSPRPVVFVHGDSHQQTVDHPLLDHAGAPIAHFTRIESFGYPFMGWVRVDVDPDAASPLRFEAHTWSPHAPRQP